MMGTSVESLIMEKSSILKEIASFDINAPISVTICFEEDYEELPIKTEPVVDEHVQNTQEIDNSKFLPIFEPKTEIINETPASHIAAETEKNVQDVHDVQDVHTPEYLQDNIINNESKKRKAENLVDHCKKGKHEAEELIANNVINKGLKAAASASVDIEQPSVETTANHANNPEDCNELRQHELEKADTYITKSLADISEQLRRIMNAYDYHKRCQTPLASFNEVKKKCFSIIYKAVVTILLPEVNNDTFMETFLNETVQRARKLAGPYYNRTYRDYATLLYEIIMRAKKIQYEIAQKQNSPNITISSETPVKSLNNITIAPENNSLTVKNIENFNLPAKMTNMQAEADKVCIFSSGLPGNEVSISINPVLSEYFQKPEQRNLTEDHSSSENQRLSTNDNNVSQVKTTAEYLAKFAEKYKNTTQQPVVVSPTPHVPNVTVTHQELPKNASRLMQNSLNHVLQPSAQTAPLPQEIQEMLKPPPPYTNPHMRREQPQQQHIQAQSSQPQIGQQQQLTMQFGQTNLTQLQQLVPQISPLQQLQAQFQQRQQITQQHQAKMQFQAQMAQSRQNIQPMTQYIQSSISPQQRQPSQLQHKEHQQQRPTDTWPSLVELLAREPTRATPFPSFNPPNIQSKHNQSPNVDSWTQHSGAQIISRSSQQQVPVQPTEWNSSIQRDANVNYQIGQVSQVTQKGVPRSSSTDSGFMSPLNFNIPADQTTPTTRLQEPDTSIPVITHVTSLSDKVAYVEMGSCVVCYKKTKQMCMGCMKVYYCNYQCQTHDWNRHAHFCMAMAAQQHANYNAVQFL